MDSLVCRRGKHSERREGDDDEDNASGNIYQGQGHVETSYYEPRIIYVEKTADDECRHEGNNETCWDGNNGDGGRSPQQFLKG